MELQLLTYSFYILRKVTGYFLPKTSQIGLLLCIGHRKATTNLGVLGKEYADEYINCG